MTNITSTSAQQAVAKLNQPVLSDRTVATQNRAAAVDTLFLGGPRKSTKGMSVKERFSTLEKRFVPSKAKGVDVSFQFELSGKGGGTWYVKIKDGKISVKEGKGSNPTVTMKASAEDYKKIADGEMNKTWAFIRGKVKIDGDKDVLKKFDSYFTGNSAKD